jgi:uncharacterized protein YutE (UPF0331/DUF86 family)
MNAPDVALLLGYIANQNELIKNLLDQIAKTEAKENEKTVLLGYLLHNLYCAVEDLFIEIPRTFENQLGDPSVYHRELLKKMSIEVPGVRPGVISSENLVLLDELRGFRHVFRHAYGFELDPAKVSAVKDRVVRGWPRIDKDLAAFERFLKSL